MDPHLCLAQKLFRAARIISRHRFSRWHPGSRLFGDWFFSPPIYYFQKGEAQGKRRSSRGLVETSGLFTLMTSQDIQAFMFSGRKIEKILKAFFATLLTSN